MMDNLLSVFLLPLRALAWHQDPTVLGTVKRKYNTERTVKHPASKNLQSKFKIRTKQKVEMGKWEIRCMEKSAREEEERKVIIIGSTLTPTVLGHNFKTRKAREDEDVCTLNSPIDFTVSAHSMLK